MTRGAPGRSRLDQLVLDRGHAESRTKAQALIRAGQVEVDGQIQDKPGMQFANDARIAVREGMPYVGRGGFKLAGALDAFGVDVAGRTCLDVGASTGGFTDVLLQRGADHVFAVDVGRGQLAWVLRIDPRVTAMERTDVRSISALPLVPSLAVVDVSFISSTLVLPVVRKLLTDDGECLLLVKPQFEAGREKVGRGGIVKDLEVHVEVLTSVGRAALEHGWRVRGIEPSALRGTSGNQEYFVWLAIPDRAATAGQLEDSQLEQRILAAVSAGVDSEDS